MAQRRRSDPASGDTILTSTGNTSLIAYGIKTKEFNEVNAEAIIDIIIFSYQGVRLYSNLMLISPQIPENILYIIKNILLK